MRNQIEWNIPNTEVLIGKENSVVNKGFSEPPIEFTPGILFSDNLWNFSDKDEVHNTPYLYKFDFRAIQSIEYRVILKNVIIRELFKQNNKIISTNGKFQKMRRFLLYLESKVIVELEQISPRTLSKYVEDNLSQFTFYNTQKNLRAIRNFLDEAFFGGSNIKLVEFEPILKQVSTADIKAELEANKTPNIPKKLFQRIIECALRDMENANLGLHHRMMACLIVIVSHTGMRKGELCLLESNRLNELAIMSGKQKAYKLDFFTYKTTANRNGKWTETIAYPNTVKAYQTLERITKDRRNVTQTNYLCVTEKGKRYSPSRFDIIFDCFFLRNQTELDFNSLSDYEKTQVHESIVTRRMAREQRGIGISYEKFYNVNCHQFRVAVANWLKDKGVTLQWIRKHMNHMDEEMTKHYFRDDDIIKETLVKRSSSDGTKVEAQTQQHEKELTEPELQKAYETINKFLKKKKLNIFKDIDEIIDTLKNNPLREMMVGVCTKAMGLLCERQDRLSTLEKWYYVSPQVPDVASFDFTYKRFIDKAKIVQHNKKLFYLNSKYKRDYEIEWIALQKFYLNRLLPEFELLCSKLEQEGKELLISTFPQLESIVSQIEDIKEEIRQWINKLTLLNSSTNELQDTALVKL